eukprot:g1953.t1
MQAWVIALLVGIPVLATVVNVAVLKAWGSPEDHGRAFFPRAVVVVSLVLAEFSVLLLPLDVGARSASIFGNVGCGFWNGECANDQDLLSVWIGLYITIASFVIFIIPFAILFYEAWEYKLGDGGKSTDSTTSCKEQCCSALRWQFVFSFVGCVILLILYAVFNKVSIPINSFPVSSTAAFAPMAGTATSPLEGYDPRASFTVFKMTDAHVMRKPDLVNMEMAVTFLIYLVACISWLGSWFFVIFAGVGVVYLPVDMIRAWKNRPRPLDLEALAKEKKAVVERAGHLLEVAKMAKEDLLKSKRTGAKRSRTLDKKNFNTLKVGTHNLEVKAEHLQLCLEITKDLEPTFMNTLMPWFNLFFGVIGCIVSFLWVLQVCMYILPRAIDSAMGNPHSHAGIPFLNQYLQMLDQSVPFFGVLTIAILVFWLQLCMVKGVFVLGLRIFVIGIHPMKYGKTLANSFLVNVSIVLLSSPSLIAFCCEAFESYTRSTDASMIFSVQIRYMQFFRPFYDMGIFTFTFLGFAVLALFWKTFQLCCPKCLWCCPCDRGEREVDEERFKVAMKKLRKAK